MKNDKKWMRRWLSLLLVLAMLFGDMQGVVSVSAIEMEPGATTEETIEVEEEETTEEPSVPEESTDESTEEPSVPEESTDESTEEPSVSEESTGESNDASEDENQPEETRPEEVVQFLADVEALRAKVEQLKQLRQLLNVSAVSVMDTMDEDFIEVEPEEGEQPEEAEPAEENSEAPALTEEERQTLQSELNALTDEVSQEFGRLCLAYYGSMERIPFFQTEEEPEEVPEEAEEPSDEIPEAEEIADIRSLLTEEEQQETERFLKELVGLLYGIQLLDTVKETVDGQILFNTIPSGKNGSGSAQLNPHENQERFFIESFADGRTTASIPRFTTLYAYLQEGETLCLGSSILNSKYAYSIEVFDVNGKTRLAQFSNDSTKVLEGIGNVGKVGYIETREQELNGPALSRADYEAAVAAIAAGKKPERYIPHQYVSTEDQKVKIVFHAVSNSTKKDDNQKCLGSAQPVSADFALGQGGVSIAAWDITVISKDGDKVEPGRAWADYLAITDWKNGITADLSLHVLTRDGYIYQVDMKKADPFGFIFFADNMGLTRHENGRDYSIYHSVAASSNGMESLTTQGVQLHIPGTSSTSDSRVSHYIFFNKPSETAKRVLCGSSTQQSLSISNLKFKGIADGVSHYGSGGTFSFTINGATSVSFHIDFKAMIAKLESDLNDPSKASNVPDSVKKYKAYYEAHTNLAYGKGIVELNGVVHEGSGNQLYWDGKDINGQFLPVGNYGTQDAQGATTRVTVKVEAKAGEVHFPMLDMEGLKDGIQIKRLTDDNSDNEEQYNIYYNNTPLAYNAYYGTTAGERSGDYYKIGKVQTCKALYAGKWQSGKVTTLNADWTHTPVSSKGGAMKFEADGGDRTALDVWTYYQIPDTHTTYDLQTVFAIVETENVCTIAGSIFYDGTQGKLPNGQRDKDANGKYTEEGISGMQVRLMDIDGQPVQHTVLLPQYDEFGNFVWDDDGNVVVAETLIDFEAITDKHGTYLFQGVPRGTSTQYYVQVELNEIQRNTFQYVCTTNDALKAFYPSGWKIQSVASDCGGDGNTVTLTSGSDAISELKYEMNVLYPKFNKSNAKLITVSEAQKTYTAPAVGYYSAIPSAEQSKYTVKKEWPNVDDSKKLPVVVELYLQDDIVVHSGGSDGQGQNTRQGVLIDTVTLDKSNNWQHTWPILNKSNQYYFVEYYNQIKELHHLHEDATFDVTSEEDIVEQNHHVLIGATDTIFSSATDNNGKPYFGDTKEHKDASTPLEKETTIDTDALLFDMTYTCTVDDTLGNLVTLTNVQTYDERAYYIWSGHEIVLNNFIGKTVLTGGEDAAENPITEFLKEPLKERTDGGVEGLSIRAYKQVNGQTVLDDKELSPYFKVVEDGSTCEVKIEGSAGQKPAPGTYSFLCTYNGHSWTMSLHIYDTEDDGIFYYTPLQDEVYVLEGYEQEADDEELYVHRLFKNDNYRVELREDAVNRSMGTCADLTGICISTEKFADNASIPFTTISFTQGDTSHSYTNDAVDITIVVSNANKPTNREDDHVNHTSISYKPKQITGANFVKTPTYVYYRYTVLSEKKVHNKAGSLMQNNGTNTDSENTQEGENQAEPRTDTHISPKPDEGVDMYSYFELHPLVTELAGATLSVGSTIDLNFYVDLLNLPPVQKEITEGEESGQNGELEHHTIADYAMDFVMESEASDGLGHTNTLQTFDENSNLKLTQVNQFGQTDDLYGFTFKDLNAYQMGETVTGRLWVNTGTQEAPDYVLLDHQDFSVKQYAYAMLQSDSGANQHLKEMLVDMLNYGAEAQTYAYSNGWTLYEGTPANSFLGGTLKNRHRNLAKANLENDKWTEELTDSGRPSNLTFLGVGLTMEEGMQMSLGISFKLANENWTNYSVRITAPEQAPFMIPKEQFILNSNRLFHIKAQGIGPFFWSEKIKVEFLDNNNEVFYTLYYSVDSYCYDMANNPNMQNLAKAIYRYSKSAADWKSDTDPIWKENIYGTPKKIQDITINNHRA